MIIVLRTKMIYKKDILHTIMSKPKHCWWIDNNYTEKLVTEILSQTTYDFFNILGVMINCWMLYLILKYNSINYWIDNKLNCLIYLILFYLGLWLISGPIY